MIKQFDQEEAFPIILIQSEVMTTSQVGSLGTRGRYNNDNRPTHSSQEQVCPISPCFTSGQFLCVFVYLLIVSGPS